MRWRRRPHATSQQSCAWYCVQHMQITHEVDWCKYVLFASDELLVCRFVRSLPLSLAFARLPLRIAVTAWWWLFVMTTCKRKSADTVTVSSSSPIDEPQTRNKTNPRAIAKPKEQSTKSQRLHQAPHLAGSVELTPRQPKRIANHRLKPRSCVR